MKLFGTLYKILETENAAMHFSSTVELNANHIVYTGHFPGHPVTPGVIQMQIVHELVEKHFARKLTLFTMDQAKFLTILDPTITPCITIKIEYMNTGDLLQVKAIGGWGKLVFFRMQSLFRFSPPLPV
ncbi:3-hydroxyacyl-ACP dehydratase [Flavihumibacter sediminis]|nr:3-hydroxyacyl-ACP dehydratase [Flavihumibacter sediminis]